MFPLSSLMYSAGLLLFICVIISSQQKSSRNKSYPCMAVCQCTNKTLPKKQDSNGTILTMATFEGIKMKCDLGKSNFSDVRTLNKILMMTMSKNLIELDLSSNQITELNEKIFDGLENLLRLNLSLNPIAKLSKDAFHGLKNLRMLDLSHTEISELKNGLFTDLQNLERLIFLETPIKLISNESLDELKSINRLDINSQILTCDCHLLWFSDWLKNRTNVLEDILCGLPSELKGRRVSSLEPEVLHCDWPLELSHFELIPSTNQVIFKGDSLPITCQATFYDSSMSFDWLHNNMSIDAKGQGNMKVISSSEKTFKVSTLELLDVDENFSGIWTCRIGSGEIYISKSINIVVLHREVTSCPASKTFDNKGDYAWPRTLAGAVKSSPCIASIDYSGIQHHEVMRAYRACRPDGTWGVPDTSSCPYVSEVTRMLKEAASLNLSLPDVTTDNALKMFHSIGPQTSYGSTIRDHTEICFIAKILEQLAVHSKKFEKVAGEVVVGLVNLSMNVPPNVLLQAQLMDDCCSRILRAMKDTISNLLSSNPTQATFSSKNVAIHGCKMTYKHTKGIACWSETVSNNHTSNVSLNCEETDSENFQDNQDHRSFLSIPRSTISSAMHGFNTNRRYKSYDNSIIEDDHDDDTSAVAIIIINLRDSRLFPVLEETDDSHEIFNDTSPLQNDDDDIGSVAGPVFMASIVSKDKAFQLSPSPSSINVAMKTPARKVTLVQVKWKELPDGRGKWTKGDCSQIMGGNKINDLNLDDDDDDYYGGGGDDDAGNDDDAIKEKHLLFKFSCQSLGAFAVAKKPPHHSITTQLLRSLREVSALVYVGCFIVITKSCVIIIVYITHWRKMEMSHKTRHVVVNLNLSLALLASTFALGVKMYRLEVLCLISTVLLHYLSISTLIWITIINFKLLYKLIKSHLEEPYNLDKQIVKSVVPDYLLGWGVPAIVCGIGSAINWEDQSPYGTIEENKICFLNKSSSILMLFLPSAIIVLINFVIFIKIAHFSRRGCYYPGGDDDDDGLNRQNSLECGSHPSMSSSSSYPPISSRTHPAHSNSDDTMVVANDDEKEAESRKISDTNRKLLQLLNKSVVGVSSGNASSLIRTEATDKSLLPLDGSSMTFDPQPKVEFDGFGTIYPPSSQLCGSAATLLLFCATWATGMLSVIRGPPRVFSGGFNSDFFRIIFVALSLALSSFMGVYFCFGRRDIRKAVCGNLKNHQRRQSFAASASREEVWHLRDSIVEQRKPTDFNPVFCKPEHSTTSVEVELLAVDNSIEIQLPFACNRHKLAPPSRNIKSGEIHGMKNAKEDETTSSTVKHSVVVDSKSSVVFYDPRQNGAARRYWEKARKKRNEARTCDNTAGHNDSCSKSQGHDFHKYCKQQEYHHHHQQEYHHHHQQEYHHHHQQEYHHHHQQEYHHHQQEYHHQQQEIFDPCCHHPTSTERLISSERNRHGNVDAPHNSRCFFNGNILYDGRNYDVNEGSNDNDHDYDDEDGVCNQEISLRTHPEFEIRRIGDFGVAGSDDNIIEEQYDIGDDDDDDDIKYKTDDNGNSLEICHSSVGNHHQSISLDNNNHQYHQRYFPRDGYLTHECGFCQCCPSSHHFDNLPSHHRQTSEECHELSFDRSRSKQFHDGNIRDARNAIQLQNDGSVQHPQYNHHGKVCLDYRNDIWVKK